MVIGFYQAVRFWCISSCFFGKVANNVLNVYICSDITRCYTAGHIQEHCRLQRVERSACCRLKGLLQSLPDSRIYNMYLYTCIHVVSTVCNLLCSCLQRAMLQPAVSKSSACFTPVFSVLCTCLQPVLLLYATSFAPVCSLLCTYLQPALLMPAACFAPVCSLLCSCLQPALLLSAACFDPVCSLLYSCLQPALLLPAACIAPVCSLL